MMDNEPIVQPGSTAAPSKFKVEITPDGPYLVYGSPPLNQQFMMPNALGEMWYYQQGDSYSTTGNPTAICRCGISRNAPYCDGSHVNCDWDPELTASEQPLLDGAETYHGSGLDLTDNEQYCAFARYCDAKGQIWKLVRLTNNAHAADWVRREADRCPAGRLSAWDRQTGEPSEPQFEPSLALLEDPTMECSGPLWVRAGIAIQRAEDGFTYEIRNRVTLCRCGQSGNKPYCDGTHASMKWSDGLNKVPSGEKY